MAEYVDKDKVVDICLNRLVPTKDGDGYILGGNHTVKAIVEKINEMPCFDIKIDKHGIWREALCDWGLFFECSLCKTNYENCSNYCPNCGARMECETK